MGLKGETGSDGGRKFQTVGSKMIRWRSTTLKLGSIPGQQPAQQSQVLKGKIYSLSELEFPLCWVKVKWKSLSHVRLFATPWTIQFMEFSRPDYWSESPFPSPGDLSNPGLPHCRWILYQLSHKGSPRILEWVAYPFSRGPYRPRNQTRVSCIPGRFFTNWAINEDSNLTVTAVRRLNNNIQRV